MSRRCDTVSRQRTEGFEDPRCVVMAVWDNSKETRD